MTTYIARNVQKQLAKQPVPFVTTTRIQLQTLSHKSYEIFFCQHFGMNPVVLVSGGLDSATTLAIAKSQSYICYALSFDYGQRHCVELKAARRVTKSIGVVEHKFINLNLDEFRQYRWFRSD